MIFKTFDSDIDKISAKWGVFGKSFNDIGNAIVGRVKDINNGFQSTDDLIGSIKNSDSVWKRLYPSKETIQSQMIDVDALYPEIDDTSFQKILDSLQKQQKFVNENNGSWSSYFKNFKEGEKWQIEFVQNTDLQKASLDDVKKAYDSAKDGAIAHNAALKQQTLSAKAGQVALKGLAMAGNMLLMWGISEAISLVATGIDNAVHKVEYAQERLEDFNSSMKETKDTLKSQQDWITENGETYSKLAKGVDDYGHNVGLTTDEFKQYNDITSQIADMFPNMVQGYNDQNEAIIKNKGNVEALTKAYKESAKAKYADIMTKSSSTYSDYKDSISDAQDQKDKITSFMNAKEITGFATSDGEYRTKVGNQYFDSFFSDLLEDEDYSQYVEEVRNLISERGKAGSNKATFTFDDLSAQLQSKIRAALTVANTTVSTETAKVKPLLEAYIYGDNNSGYDKLSEKGQQAIKNVITNLDEGFYSKFSSDNDMFAYFQNNFIEPLKDAVNGDELAIEINTLFELDKSKYKNYAEYIAAVEEKIKELKNAKDENGNPIFTDEQLNQLRKSKGVADVDSNGNVSGNALINKTKDKYKNIKGASTYIDTLTEDELRYINGLETEVKTVDELKGQVEALDNDTKNKTKNVKKSFSSIWNELKDSEQKSLKKSVLAGTFDQEELDKYQTLANNFSLKKVREEILNTIALDDKIGQFLSDTDKLTTAYQEMQKNGVVSTKTLQGMPDGLRNLEGYTDFRNTVSSSKASKADKKSSFESLITEYIQTNDTIKNVTSETRDYVINALKDIGVTNAEAVVDSQLEATETVKKTAKEIESLNYDELQNFLKIANSKGKINAEVLNKIGENTSILFNSLSGKYKKDLTNYTTALQKKLEADAEYQKEKAKLENIETEVQNNAPNIAKSTPLSQRQLSSNDFITKLASNKQKENVDKSKKKLTKAEKDLQKQQKKLEKILKSSKLTKLKYEPTTSSSNNKKSGSSSSGSTTTNQIDWIERKLTVLSKKLDVAKSKYDALFATSKAKDSDTFVNQQNKALEEQIKIQDKVIAANNKAEKSYSKIAKKYAKKISSTHKNLVKYGGYTIENFTTKDTTKKTKKSKKGTKKVKVTKNEYDNIQKYIEYLDKVSDTKSNKSKAQQEKVNLQIEQKQNSQTRAETKQSMYKAQEENASGLSKNNYIKDQITQLTKSYNLQIEIARLQKDYDKAKQLEAEKQKQINQLRYHEVENIKTAYENQVSLLDAQEANIQSQVDLAEARGDIVSKAYYSSMSNIEKQKQSNYNDELNKLRAKQSNFATGSDEWYDLQKDIQDVVEKISGSEKAIVENTKAIGELNDKMYESIDATASKLDTEADFLAGLIPGETTDSDTGKLTDAGLAKLYAAGISYSAYQATAQKENARLKQIQDANKSGTLLEGYASLQAQKDAESTIAKAAQEANNSIKSHADEIVDFMKSAIDASMNYLQDIIDARKDLLNQEKELYDYQKQLLEKTKTVSSLQKQLYASSGDYSEEGRLKTAQLRQSLDEAQQDLQDTEYDKYISDQQEMLDNLMDEYKDLMEDLQKNENELLKQGITAINDNKIVMDNIFKKTASDYGYPTSSELDNARSALASGLISVMNSGDENSITSVIKAECDKIVQAYSKADGNSSSTTTTPQNPTQQGTGTGSVGGTAAQENAYAQQAKRMVEIESFKAWLKSISGSGMNKPLTKAKSGKKYSSDINKALSKYGYVVKSTKLSGGVKAIDDFARRLDPTITSGDGKFSKDGKAYQALKKKYGSLGFKTGGIGTLVKASGEDGIAMVRNGEGFISPENVKDIKDLMNLIPDITSFMTPKMDMGKYVDKLSPVNRTVNVDNITFELPNVKNTVDFTDTIKTPSQQKAFASAIGDAINGNRLNINRY